MDDMRQRYRLPRRDYGLPADRRPQRPKSEFTPEAPRPAPPAPPTPMPGTGRPTKPAKPKKRFKKVLAAAILLLFLAGGAGWWYRHNLLAAPIPSATLTSVDFPLFYPSKLPPGFSIDKASFITSDGVVLYSAVNGSLKIAFTVQKVPPAFDFKTFYKQGLLNTTTFDTDIGQAAIGTANGRLVGSLSDGQSWLLINSDVNQLRPSDLSLILKNVKQLSK